MIPWSSLHKYIYRTYLLQGVRFLYLSSAPRQLSDMDRNTWKRAHQRPLFGFLLCVNYKIFQTGWRMTLVTLRPSYTIDIAQQGEVVGVTTDVGYRSLLGNCTAQLQSLIQGSNHHTMDLSQPANWLFRLSCGPTSNLRGAGRAGEVEIGGPAASCHMSFVWWMLEKQQVIIK